MGHCNFRLFVRGDGRCGMKCNGIPHKLRLLRRDTAILKKRARRIGAVYLEAILRGVPVGQTQIVQNSGYGQKLRIRCKFGAF